MRRPASIALSACAVAASVAGCGATTTSTPDATPAAPAGSYPASGLSFTPPTGFQVAKGSGHLVATAQAGDATVAVWRYARKGALPSTEAELKAARDGLLAASSRHDGTFRVIKTAPTTVADQPAVQIRAKATIAGRPRTVRSTHIYAGGAEIVVDAYATDPSFRRTDAQVFRPLLRSLRISAPQPGA